MYVCMYRERERYVYVYIHIYIYIERERGKTQSSRHLGVWSLDRLLHFGRRRVQTKTRRGM